MKANLALASLALVGFVVGCGSTEAHPITVVGTTTISSVKTGTLIRCKGGPGAKVPPPGSGVGAAEVHMPGAKAPSPGELQITHRRDGSVTASCKP